MRFLSTKKFLVGGLAALTLVLAGCLTDDSTDEGPSITAQPASQTKVVGDTVTMSVTATGTGTLSYRWVVLLAGSTTYDTLEETTATIKFVADVEKDGGLIKCVVKDSKGTTVSSSATLTVTGTVWGTDKIDSLGAQANLGLGSVIDLDSGKVWSSGTANLNQAKIDLVYLYYGGAGDSAASLNGALAAKDSCVKYGIGLADGYTAAVDIKLVKVTAKPSSQHHAKYAYDNGTKLRSVRIVAGDKFVVLTTGGKYAYIEVTSVSGKTAGTAKVTFNIGTI